MAKDTITKVTRRAFIFLSSIIFTPFKFLRSSNEIYGQTEEILDKKDYMEVKILPEEFRPPYSPKTKEVLYNYIKSGKSRKKIKQDIINKFAKTIRIPLK